MHLATAKEHRNYFLNHKRIEFEGMLTPEQCQKIYDFIVLDKKGRDYWRRSSAIKKIACNYDFAQVASELTGVREIRVVYDELIDLLPKETTTLTDISCIQGLIGGWIFCIQKPSDSDEVFSEFFPQNVGDAIFFSADCPILFEDIVDTHKKSYLLIAYGNKDAVYIHNPKDPYLHQMKELGYMFGDRLRDLNHPIIYPKI